VKSYFFNGMSHLYGMVAAIRDMLADQERNFKDACAQNEVLVTREYYRPNFEYLREIRIIVSSKALNLIAQEQRKMLASISSANNLRPIQLGSCRRDYSISTELGIPYCHTLYSKMEEAKAFTK
jgi:hypothetical protein